ncbi:GerAB/ArcD/ProY family transporter [Paenibacillus gansuensis]|uniref:GerAB/ArcD/ProY family transporter n=1 Tax=Paenibacillus gansuensis TaxID=306542 RepID=A0ABW5PBI6_9BACL
MKGNVAPRQLFCMMFLFELGSSVVVGLGLQAKQAAWVAVLIGMAAGLLLMAMYYYIYRFSPSRNWAETLVYLLGPYAGTALALGYMLYFLYIGSRVLGDFGYLISITAFNETPVLVMNAVMMILIMYSFNKGILVLARGSEIMFGFLFFVGIIVAFLTGMSGIVKPEQSLPLFEDGLKPLLQTAFPLTVTFPFGELIVFLMILPTLRKEDSNILATMLKAVFIGGVTLAAVIWTEIAVLGPDRASMELFPLMTVLGKVGVGDFIQRLDAVVLSLLIVGVFFKIAVYYYGAVTSYASLLKMSGKGERGVVAVLIGGAMLWLSIAMSRNYSDHIKVGLQAVPYYMHVPMQIAVPLIVTLFIFIRSRRQGK